jgi:hypothetical protein
MPEAPKIGCTLVEPGGAHTDFRNCSARVADTLAAYDASPSGWSTGSSPDTSRPSPGDPAKMVEAMIASVDQEPTPRRIALGSERLSGHARPALHPTGGAGSATRTRLLDLMNRARDA